MGPLGVKRFLAQAVDDRIGSWPWTLLIDLKASRLLGCGVVASRAASLSVRLRPRRKPVKFDESSLSFEVVDSFVWDGVVDVAEAAHRQDVHVNVEAFEYYRHNNNTEQQPLPGELSLH